MSDGLDHIAERLRSLSRDGGSIEAAQVKLLGLDEIRDAAGPRWPRMRDRVRSGSLAIIQQHLGPADVALPAGDGFLIFLANAPGGAAYEERCATIRDALMRFYLGEDALKSLRPDLQRHSLSAERFNELVVSTVSVERQSLVAKSPTPDIAAAPIFAIAERRVGASLCAPMILQRQQRRIGYNPDFVHDGRHLNPDYVECDIAILDEALSHIEQARTLGQPRAIGFCVHASTMQQRKSREAYLSWLDGIDPEIGRRLFVVISEIEKGTPLISIAQWSATLRSHVARVWLDFHYTDHAIASISGTGAFAAGFQLPPFAQTGNPRAAHMMDQVSFWKRSVRGQGMRLFVGGFQDKQMFIDAARVGVDFAASDTLWTFEAPAHNGAQAHAASAPSLSAAGAS